MPKKRKTRKQKIIHDQRVYAVHETPPLMTSPQKNETLPKEQEAIAPDMTFTLPTSTNKATVTSKRTKTETVTVSSSEYGYIGNDLIRTALLTGAIVLTELLIRLFFVR